MTVELYRGDCLELLPTLADSSINLILTDPPYYKVKALDWDRQWSTAAEYLEWLGRVLDEFYRVLAPNGSLYLFASPKMAARVELAVGERFEVLNNITWQKAAQSYAEKYGPENFRQFVPMSERIVFAEHHGADGYAKGEAGYGRKCDELRGFVFEPLRAYLASERDRAGLTTQDLAEVWRIKTRNSRRTGMVGHWFSQVQWSLPTAENYQWLRYAFEDLTNGGEYLRRDYEYLRRDYEDLRRPFYVSADVPYTDVWTFPTVQAYPGKHPCEKPIEMIEHIISASSREGDTVADFFFGSGNVAIAANQLEREFVGSELSGHWYGVAHQRIEAAQSEIVQLEMPSCNADMTIP